MDINYERLEWEDYPSIETPLSAENLNHLEEGIAALYSERYELQSNIAYVEDGETASKEYLPNSYLMKDGLFYKVTKPIYYGDTFDSGEDGNITHVNISSQFGSGGGGSTGCVELTLAQYNALSEESKMADVIYLITDSPDNYLDEVFGDFATVEPTSTASKPYEAGDYLVYDYKFYKVTSAIEQGGTIVTSGASANVEQTTVGDEITKQSSGIGITYDNTTSGLAATNVQSALDEVNRRFKKFVYNSEVYLGDGTDHIYIPESQNPGYRLVAAHNGDWNNCPFIPLGFAQQNTSYVVFFSTTLSQGQRVRIDTFWYRFGN